MYVYMYACMYTHARVHGCMTVCMYVGLYVSMRSFIKSLTGTSISFLRVVFQHNGRCSFSACFRFNRVCDPEMRTPAIASLRGRPQRAPTSALGFTSVSMCIGANLTPCEHLFHRHQYGGIPEGKWRHRE